MHHETDTPQPTTPDLATQRRAMLAGVAGLAAGAFLTSRAGAGDLNPPPGPISPTMKPLDQIEPRIAINSVNTPGSSQSNFIISQPGSYYLTGNITGTSGRNGLAITASNVTVDLMGYALIGVPGSTNGITSTSSVRNIQIRNGVVSGWASIGINLAGPNSRVSDIISADNGSHGINLGSRSSVANSTASSNGGNGIFASSTDCSASNCSCSDNGSNGISLGVGASVVDCVASVNSLVGIRVSSDSTVLSCTTRGNGSHGIEAGWAGVVSHCAAVGNGGFGIFTLSGNASITDCTARSNSLGGIRVFQQSLVRGNNCSGNNASGAPGILMASSRNRIESNLCSGNSVGIKSTGERSLIFANTCSNNSTNWEIAATNYCWAPNILPTSPINGTTGGGFSPFGGGTPDPLANYSY